MLEGSEWSILQIEVVPDGGVVYQKACHGYSGDNMVRPYRLALEIEWHSVLEDQMVGIHIITMPHHLMLHRSTEP